MRRYLTPRCLGMHVTLLVLLPVFVLLTRWQFDRAVGGNTLSWAYTFEWPLFAGYAVYVWWQLIHDQPRGVPHRRVAGSTAASGAGPIGRAADDGAADDGVEHDEPGWALSGGRVRNVAIASRAPIDEEVGGRGERYRAQTAEEAERLAAYNRYLAELSTDDKASTSS